MGINAAFQNAIDISLDSDSSTAPNSMIGESGCSIIDNNKYLSNINSVAFTNSSNIQIGDRIVYNGPVTITQELSNTDKNSLTTPNTQKSLNFFDIKKKKILFIVISILIILTLIIVIIYSFKTISNKPKPFELKIISRDEWEARPPVDEEFPKLKLPLGQIIISHTVMRNCYTKDSCKNNLKEIQEVHFEWDFGDIGFNFIIGNDGNVYEGRGWDIVGAHTKGYNSISFGIAFNGNFENEVPNKNQIMAAFLLFDEGVRLGKLKSDYKIYGMRQFKETKSPGDALYQMMQTWDHWSEET